MSDSVRPHRQQPTRLPVPGIQSSWNSPAFEMRTKKGKGRVLWWGEDGRGDVGSTGRGEVEVQGVRGEGEGKAGWCLTRLRHYFYFFMIWPYFLYYFLKYEFPVYLVKPKHIAYYLKLHSSLQYNLIFFLIEEFF